MILLGNADARAALELASGLDPALCRLKVGKELFTRAGPDVVRELQKLGFEVFLDLKFHDIPHTVASAVHAAADLGVWMVNVHASGGRRMMIAARERLCRDGGGAALGFPAFGALQHHAGVGARGVGERGAVEHGGDLVHALLGVDAGDAADGAIIHLALGDLEVAIGEGGGSGAARCRSLPPRSLR